MRIEHIGISVESPGDMARWYVRNLGCRLLLAEGDARHEAVFLADGEQSTVLELTHVPQLSPTGSVLTSTTQLHIAFLSDDPYGQAKKLEEDGAALVEDHSGGHPGEVLLLLKDPWGNYIQLVKREAGRSLRTEHTGVHPS